MSSDYVGTTDQTGTSTTDKAKEAAGQVKDEAARVGQSAAQSGQHLAGEAKSQAKDVAAEAGRQARTVVDQAKTTLSSQAGQQQQRLAGGLRQVGTQLGSMADGSSEQGVATDLARQLADRSHAVAGWLEEREPGDMLEEVKTFARTRPGTFLAVAVGLGVLAGRVTRGVRDASSDSGARSAYATDTGYDGGYGTSAYPATTGSTDGGATGSTYGTTTATGAYLGEDTGTGEVGYATTGVTSSEQGPVWSEPVGRTSVDGPPVEPFRNPEEV